MSKRIKKFRDGDRVRVIRRLSFRYAGEVIETGADIGDAGTVVSSWERTSIRVRMDRDCAVYTYLPSDLESAPNAPVRALGFVRVKGDVCASVPMCMGHARDLADRVHVSKLEIEDCDASVACVRCGGAR